MTDCYMLEGTVAVPCEDVRTWAKWFETANRHVAKNQIGAVRVSTVFLGLDHSFDEGPPLLFETMIFGGTHDEEQWRYATWDEAVAGHRKAVALVKEHGGGA